MNIRIFSLCLMFSIFCFSEVEARKIDIGKEMIIYRYSYNEKTRTKLFPDEQRLHNQVMKHLRDNKMTSDFYVLVADVKGGRAIIQPDGTFNEKDDIIVDYEDMIEDIVGKCLFNHVLCIYDDYTNSMRYVDNEEDVFTLIDTELDK